MSTTLGERIKTIRTENKLTQKELADRMSVTAPYISQIEKNKEEPTEMFLKLFSYEFNVSLNYIKNGFYDDSLNDNKEGYLKKYKEGLDILNRIVQSTEDKDLQYITETFTYFVSLISGNGYTLENRTIYYKMLHDMLDQLEQIQFHSKTILGLGGNSSSGKEKALIFYLDEFQEKIKLIDMYTKEIANVFLKQYEFKYRLK
jgi:hypothetical protein